MIYDLFNPIPDNSVDRNSRINISGLTYVPNFISSKEEQQLSDAINSEKWLTDIKRRVQHYGYKYDYKARSINYEMYLGQIPEWAFEIAERIHKNCYMDCIPDQLIVNEYLPGQGIANHVDCEPCFADTIISLSLNSHCIMDFINIKSRNKVEVLLEPRSLVVIKGDARYNWTHGIPQRKSDTFHFCKYERKIRLSITFRKVIIKS